MDSSLFVDNNQLRATWVTLLRNRLVIPGINTIDVPRRAHGSCDFDPPKLMTLHQTDIVSLAILCLPGTRGLRRRRRHTSNFGDRSDLALYLRDFSNCIDLYYPPSARILFQMEMALDRTRITLHVH